jgi:hypothetical protein
MRFIVSIFSIATPVDTLPDWRLPGGTGSAYVVETVGYGLRASIDAYLLILRHAPCREPKAH